MYYPDPRTADRQRYCSAAECKRASKRMRQQKWLSNPENRDYFKGPDQVARVQQWRKAHPGYGRKVPGKWLPMWRICRLTSRGPW
jgi:hypothetical protein